MIAITEHAINSLYKKLRLLNIEQLDVSAYNKKYLSTYIKNYSFYMGLYKQLLNKTLDHLHKPVNETTFIDYGGGCGILSYLAKEMGFKNVVYTDIYKVSANDAKVISEALKIKPDHFIAGDIDEFINQIKRLNLKPDVICSFDVLEHIYDWKLWIEKTMKLSEHFSLLFMTSANGANPFIKRKIKRIHLQTEYKGFNKDEGWKDIDLETAFFTERKKIISTAFPGFNKDDVTLLAKESRGLIKADIEKLAADFIKTRKINYHFPHPTNTCDPYTGSWSENLIDINELKTFIESKNLKVDITNALHSYGNSKIQNTLKYILNVVIKISGRHNLFFSPAYVLEIDK
jgi:2-polyprenyl-3-methyl-5-hydroxy-6-metoxy-1,4-benzoquinol methylase